MSDLSDEAKAELKAALDIFKEDHVLKTVKGFFESLNPKPGDSSDPKPPPTKPPTEDPPKKKGLWWGEES